MFTTAGEGFGRSKGVLGLEFLVGRGKAMVSVAGTLPLYRSILWFSFLWWGVKCTELWYLRVLRVALWRGWPEAVADNKQCLTWAFTVSKPRECFRFFPFLWASLSFKSAITLPCGTLLCGIFCGEESLASLCWSVMRPEHCACVTDSWSESGWGSRRVEGLARQSSQPEWPEKV